MSNLGKVTKPKRDRTRRRYEWQGHQYTRQADEAGARDADGKRVSDDITKAIEADGLQLKQLSAIADELGERITTLGAYRDYKLLPRHREGDSYRTYYNIDEVRRALDYIRSRQADGLTLEQIKAERNATA